MDFDLTAAQRQRYDDVLSAVRERLPQLRPFPDEPVTRLEWKVAAQIGLTGACVPLRLGGSGLGALETALSLEAFGRACPETGLVFAVAAHLLACAVPLRDFGGDGIARDLLSAMAAGDAIGANAITEDGAGSDVSAIAMTAVRDGEEYILDGEKSFASNAPIADVLITYAVTDPKAGFLGLTAFSVPTDTPGVEVGKPFVKSGLSACPASRVRFSECRVPAECRIGAEGQGTAVFQHSMTWERTCLGAAYLGMMDRQLELCVDHARHRRQFGRRLGEFQAVSHRIVEMKQRLESARLLLYRASWLLDQGRAQIEHAALAKLAVSDAAVANSLDAVQIFGGTGYLAGSDVERQLRDSIPAAIFSGTSDIQREVVARELGL